MARLDSDVHGASPGRDSTPARPSESRLGFKSPSGGTAIFLTEIALPVLTLLTEVVLTVLTVLIVLTKIVLPVLILLAGCLAVHDIAC